MSVSRHRRRNTRSSRRICHSDDEVLYILQLPMGGHQAHRGALRHPALRDGERRDVQARGYQGRGRGAAEGDPEAGIHTDKDQG